MIKNNLIFFMHTSLDTSEEIIDLKEVYKNLVDINKRAADAANKLNKLLKELGLPPI